MDLFLSNSKNIQKIKKDLHHQRRRDKQLFRNIFEKKCFHYPNNTHHHNQDHHKRISSKKNIKTCQQQRQNEERNIMNKIRHKAKQAANYYAKHGMPEKEKEINNEIEKWNKNLLKEQNKQNETNKKHHQGLKKQFLNPSEQMIHEAKECHGIDLTDVRVKCLLETMCNQYCQQENQSETLDMDSVYNESICKEKKDMLMDIIQVMNKTDLISALKTLNLRCSYFQSISYLRKTLLQNILDSDENVDTLMMSFSKQRSKMDQIVSYKSLWKQSVICFVLFFFLIRRNVLKRRISNNIHLEHKIPNIQNNNLDEFSF